MRPLPMAMQSSVSLRVCRRWRQHVALQQQKQASSRWELQQQQRTAQRPREQRLLLLLVQHERQQQEMRTLQQHNSRQQGPLHHFLRGGRTPQCIISHPRQQAVLQLQRKQTHAVAARRFANLYKHPSAPVSANLSTGKHSTCSSSSLRSTRWCGHSRSDSYPHCRRNSSIFDCGGDDCTRIVRTYCTGRSSPSSSSLFPHSNNRRSRSNTHSSRCGSVDADSTNTHCSSTGSGKCHSGSGRCSGSPRGSSTEVNRIYSSQRSTLGSSCCLADGTSESGSSRSGRINRCRNRNSNSSSDNVEKRGPCLQPGLCASESRPFEVGCSGRQDPSYARETLSTLPVLTAAELLDTWTPASLLSRANAAGAHDEEAGRLFPPPVRAGVLPAVSDAVARASTAASAAEAAVRGGAAPAPAFRGVKKGGAHRQRLSSLLCRQRLMHTYPSSVCDGTSSPVSRSFRSVAAFCGSSSVYCTVAAQERHALYRHAAAVSCRPGGAAAEREGETVATEAACERVTETSHWRAADAAGGDGRSRGGTAGAAARLLALKGGPGRVVPENASNEEVATRPASRRGVGAAAEDAGRAARGLAAGAATAAAAAATVTATQATEAAAAGDQQEGGAHEGYEVENEYIESGELFINPLCMQMDQRLLQCESAEEVLTLLVSHRGVLFVKNLVTALGVLADFAAATGDTGSSISRDSSSSSRSATTSSSVDRSSGKSAGSGSRRTENGSRILGGSKRTGTGSSSEISLPRGDDNNSDKCEVVLPLGGSSDTEDAANIVDQGVLGRYLEGPVPRGWPRDRISYRELFSYLNTNEGNSSSSSSNSKIGGAATQMSRRPTRVGQPEAAWVVQDERYEVLLDDLRFHRRSLSFEAAVRVVLALRRLNHRHYGLLSAMLHPLAKRAIPLPPAPPAAAAAAEAVPREFSSSSLSDAGSAATDATTSVGTVGCPSPSVATSPADAAVGVSASFAEATLAVRPYDSSSCSMPSPAVPPVCEVETRTNQQHHRRQRQQLQQRQDLYRAARMQKRYEQAVHARMQQLLRCAGVYVWAGYTQHPFFDRVVRLFSAALRPCLHERLTLSLTAAAAAIVDRDNVALAGAAHSSAPDRATAAARTKTASPAVTAGGAPSGKQGPSPADAAAAVTIPTVSVAVAPQSTAPGRSTAAEAATVATSVVGGTTQLLLTEMSAAGAADHPVLSDVNAAPAFAGDTRQLDACSTAGPAAPADAAAPVGTVLSNCPTLLVDCLRLFSSLQVSQTEHAYVAAAAARLLLSSNKRLFFTLSPDDTAALTAAVAEFPPLLHISPCMRIQEPHAATKQHLDGQRAQQLLQAPSGFGDVLQLQHRSAGLQLLPPGEAEGVPQPRRQGLLPDVDGRQYPQVLQRPQQHPEQEQYQQQHLGVRQLVGRMETPQQWQVGVEKQQQQLPGMGREHQEQLDRPRQQPKQPSVAQQYPRMQEQVCVYENHPERVDGLNTDSADVGLHAGESSTQRLDQLAKSAAVLQRDAGGCCSIPQRAAAAASAGPASSPVVDVSASLPPSRATSALSVTAHKERCNAAGELGVGISSHFELLSRHQRSSPVLALLWAAADHVERHFAAFSLAALTTVLSSFQRQQLLFPVCILRAAARGATHLRLAANTRQEAQISVAEIGKLLHACTFFGLSTLSRPASAALCAESSADAALASATAVAFRPAGASAPSTTFENVQCGSQLFSVSPSSLLSGSSSSFSSGCLASPTTQPLCLRAADGEAAERVDAAAAAVWATAPGTSTADSPPSEANMYALPGPFRSAEAVAPKEDTAAVAAAARAAEEVSAAAAAVAALCDSAAAYLEQHLDEIEEKTAIYVCYALAAVKGATARHGYLLSHVYRKIGKGTTWEKHRVLVFQLWLSQLLQFPSLSYNMPRRCVFEGLRAWCMQRGGYGAPWPEEVTEISSLLKRMHVRHRAFARPQQGGPYEIDILLQAPNLENTAMLVTTESAKNGFEPAGGTALQQQHLSLLAGITRVACVNRALWKNLPTRACKILLLLQTLQWLSFWAEKQTTSAASGSSPAASCASTA